MHKRSFSENPSVVNVLKIVDFFNILLVILEKVVPNFFDKERNALHYKNMQLYSRLGLKLNKIHCVLEHNQSVTMSKTIC